MADLSTLIRDLIADGSLDFVRTNPLAQFGPPNRPYLGATILPERIVPNNEYREMGIQYRTVIANDGERYSPAQIKASGQIVGEFLVELGNSDLALEMTPADYDALILYAQSLGQQGFPAMSQAAQSILRLADRAVAGLAMLTEKQRWQAIVGASVTREGDNGFAGTITYPNPAGHRAAAGGTWSSDSYDPYGDLVTMQELFADKGYSVSRMITSTKVAGILTRNAKMAARFAPVRVLSGSDYFNTLTLAGVNAGLQANGLPAIEVNDALWRDQVTSGRMLADTVFVMVAQTDDEAPEIADGDDFMPDLGNTVGYTAIGRPSGQAASGRALELIAGEGKGATIRAEAWQTSMPVITHPEGIAVVTGIS